MHIAIQWPVSVKRQAALQGCNNKLRTGDNELLGLSREIGPRGYDIDTQIVIEKMPCEELLLEKFHELCVHTEELDKHLCHRLTVTCYSGCHSFAEVPAISFLKFI